MSIKATSGIIQLRYKGTSVGSALEKFINREIDSYAQRYKTSLTKAMKQIEQNAVLEWYQGSGLLSGPDVASALRVESAFIRNTSKNKIIRITSYFDQATLDATSEYFESAVRWNAKHSKPGNVSPGVYIFNLRWNEGITALPNRARDTNSGWVNDNFIVSPLESLNRFCFGAVKSGLESAARNTLRGRNQNMGAGVFSPNRGGVNNLIHGKVGKK